MYISKDVSLIDRFIIYKNSLLKLIKGTVISIGMRKKSFPLFVGKKVSISHKRNIYCGKKVKFESYSEIHGLSKQGLVFSDNVTIGRYTEIRPSSYYGVGNIGEGLYIGKNSSIGPNGFIGCSGKITIGNNVMIGPKVSMFAENHNFSDTDIDIKGQGVNNKGIVIEDNCWIGSNVVILDGVTIGSGSVIGADTLVTKNIPKNSIVYDIRRKKIGSRY